MSASKPVGTPDRKQGKSVASLFEANAERSPAHHSLGERQCMCTLCLFSLMFALESQHCTTFAIDPLLDSRMDLRNDAFF